LKNAYSEADRAGDLQFACPHPLLGGALKCPAERYTLPRQAQRYGGSAMQAAGAMGFSAYRTRTDEKLWVITEWDRSVTTLLLPEEY
jgi:hypothetical protein